MRSRDKYIEAARKHADQGRFDLAIAEYRRLLAEHPDDLRSRVKLGFLHTRSGDKPAAMEVWLEAAHAYEQRGAEAEAAVVLQQVLQLAPDHVDAYLWLAQLLGQLGQPAESRRALEAAHALLEERGRLFEALRVLEDMVALDPGNVALCIRLGEAYAAQDRTAEAVETLSKAADVLRVAEWVDDFIRVAERLVWLQPDNVALSRELATHYLRQRDPQSALQKLKRCYEADQTDTETLKLLADTFIDLRQPEKAATILRVLADVFEQRGSAERANGVRDQADRLDPVFARTEREPSAARPAVPRGQAAAPRGRATTGAAQVDPTVLRLQEGDWAWTPPAAADLGDLSPLEMSMQTDGGAEGAPRRFLPAITAEGRHGRGAPPTQHRTVTTQELDLSDLIFLEQQRTATTVTPQGTVHPVDRAVTTQELDLNELEEVPSFRTVVTEELPLEEGDETPKRPGLSTQEAALSELEELAGELSDRCLGLRAGGAADAAGRERETVRLRHRRLGSRIGPEAGPGEEATNRRRRESPEAPTGAPTEEQPVPRRRPGRRFRR